MDHSASDGRGGNRQLRHDLCGLLLRPTAGPAPSTGFDCSGLVYYCYGQFGYSLNRVADDQMDNGTAVSYDNLQVGDLVFFGSGSYANHVGIYIGNGNFVHAANPSSGVRVSSLNETYYANRYIGARRIIVN